MSSSNMEEVKEVEKKVGGDDAINLNNNNQVGDDHPVEEGIKGSENVVENIPIATPQKEEEEIMRKKYGGMLLKKKPLISKDHERAFFDSADWALGKQGAQKPKGPLEALRPKLQPTPHNQMRSRRSAYAPADECDDDDGNDLASVEDEKCTILDDGNDKNKAPQQDQSCHE